MKRFFRRLDSQLSLLIGLVVGLWFISFAVSAVIVNREREEKNSFLERERIRIRIESETPVLLNDLILNHRKSLELTVRDLYQSLGLQAIELSSNGKALFQMGVEQSDGSRFVLSQRYPLSFDGKEYGVLSVRKELWLLTKSETMPKVLVFGVALVMLVIFFFVRRFIQRQVVKPLNQMIQLEEEPSFSSTSEEMAQVWSNLCRMRSEIHRQREKAIENEKQVAIGNLASQVAHDIRSPLLALAAFQEGLAGIPDEKRSLLKAAIERIQSVADGLLMRDKKAPARKAVSLFEVADGIIAEKRIQYSANEGIQFELHGTPEVRDARILCDEVQLKCMFSNLVDNAFDAVSGNGMISLWFSVKGRTVILRLSDTGEGIPREIQSELFKKYGTYNKSGGTGLGLFQAKEAMESWGGTIDIESEPGTGTCVTLSWPLVRGEPKIIDRLMVGEGAVVGILDDDRTVYAAWENRFAKHPELHTELKYFATPEQLADWKKTGRSTTYLIDYRLGRHPMSGLDVVEALGIEGCSILVTSLDSNEEVRIRCAELGVPLLPKNAIEQTVISSFSV